ncbi:MAG: class IV adenylate cyclase [Candidatus Saganbacteria bacterium]|nr:class IV adenylate cyclase [Candidatus Saganbacteria bacterium]
MANETEIKFRLRNPDDLRAKLQEIGTEFAGKQHELDLFFDCENTMRKKLGMIRIRKTRDKGFLTFKGPTQKDSQFKIREEIEVEVNDPDKLIEIFSRMGYRQIGGKEKEREVYHFKNIHILLDRLPFIGYYLELEGEKEEIMEAVTMLGLDMKDSTPRSYSDLFSLYCQLHKEQFVKKGMEPSFTFQAEAVFKA